MNVHDERALWMRWRLDVPADVPWRTQGPVLHVLLFLFTALGVAAFAALLDEALDIPHGAAIAGVAAIGIAEWLIRVRRWFFTGVETALWGGALCGFVFDLPSANTENAALAFAIAFALAGWRTRSPILGGLSASCLVFWFERRDLGVICALVIGVIALFALLRTWRRPSTEWLWIVLAVAMPAVGRPAADEIWVRVTICLYAMYAVLAFALALSKRTHTYFAAGGVAAAIASVDFARTIHLRLPLEGKLALGGAVLLGGSWLVSHLLRDRTKGIVTTPENLGTIGDLVELAATAGIPQASFEPAREGGGEFGGAGATGKY